MAANSQLPSLPHLINGEFVHSDTRHWRDVVNPATQEVLARVPMATQAEVAAAVAAGKAAFAGWKQTPVGTRARIFLKYQQLIRTHMAELAAILTAEQGKTLPDANITAVHRSDDSGTTENFTKYLKAAAPKTWTAEPGKAWTGKGEGKPKSDGVAQAVKGTPGGIAASSQAVSRLLTTSSYCSKRCTLTMWRRRWAAPGSPFFQCGLNIRRAMRGLVTVSK